MKRDLHTDEQFLMEQFKRGETAAFEIIFKRNYPALCLFLQKMGVDTFPAEEMLNDLFLKLWDKCADFDSLEGIRGFLYISSKNAALNHFDKLKRLQKREEHYLAQQDQWTSFPVQQQIIYLETLKTIEQVIGQLPDQCQQVMQLMFIEGLTPQEVADQLNIARGTVYNQKARGLSFLKEKLSLEQFLFLLLFFDF